MKYGYPTDPRKNIIDEIRSIRSMGFDYPEIFIEDPENMADSLIQRKDEIMNELEKFPSQIAHAVWYIPLGSLYEAVRLAWITECKKMIDASQALGINKLVLHSHHIGMSLHSEKRKNVLDTFAKSAVLLADYGKKKGVELLLENGGEKVEIVSIDDINYIINMAPDMKIHFDVGHSFVAGGQKYIDRFVKIFSNRISHVHIHDNHGKADEHLPLGKGKINFKRVAHSLNKIGYNKTIILEVFTKKSDVKKSLKKARMLFGE